MGVIRLAGDGDRDADLRLEDPAVAPTDLWRELASRPVVQEAVEHATRTLVDGLDRTAAVDELLEEGVTALEELFASRLVDAVAREQETDDVSGRTDVSGADVDDEEGGPWGVIHAALPTLGGQTSLGPKGGEDAILDGPIQLFAASGVEPTLDVVLGQQFMSLEADRREALLGFLVDVSAGMTVRLEAGPVIRNHLVRRHDDVLPASCVNDARDRTLVRAPTAGALEERVDAALSRLAWDDPAWRTLWTIAETPREQRRYSELYADVRLDVGKSAIRKQLGRLEDAGLVDRRREGNQHVAAVTHVGIEAVQPLREDVGLPGGPDTARDSDARESAAAAASGPAAGGASPEGCGGNRDTPDGNRSTAGGSASGVNDPLSSSAGAVFSPCEGGRGETGPAGGQPEAAARDGPSRGPTTEYLARRRHDAIVGASSGVDVALLDAEPPEREHPGDRLVSFDEDRDELVVDVQAHPTRMAVTAVRLAAALASNDLMYHSVDLPQRLEDGDGPLGGLELNEVVLRKGRCIGWLGDEDLEGSRFVDRLRRAREQLLEDTNRLSASDGEYRSDVASDVLADALGLAGTLTHLYDLLDVDVHRHISFPDWRRNWNPEKEARRQSVKRFLAYSTTISSHHGAYVMYRKLYEHRLEKREDALQGPAVDPEDPVGEHIGSWTLTGPGISDFSLELDRILSGWDVHPDAVDDQREFFVDLEVGQGWRREAVVATAGRVLERKRLRLSSATTSLLLGLLESPFALADGLDRLKEEDPGDDRHLHLDEVRFAVSMLDVDEVLPSASIGARKIVAALLESGEGLSTSRLADRAGVDEATVREHRDRLAALGLLDVQEHGDGRATLHRLQLPRRDERRSEDAPAPRFLEDVGDQDVVAAGLPHVVESVLNDLGESIAAGLPDVWRRLLEREADVDEVWRRRERWRWLGRWGDVLAAFAGEEIGGSLEWADGPLQEAGRLGAEPSAPPSRQLSLQESLGLAAAD